MIVNDILPNWSDFQLEYVRPGIPCQYVVLASPQVGIFVEQGPRRIGVRFESSRAASSIERGGLVEVTVDSVTVQGTRYLQFATSNESLFRNFYELVSEVANDVAGKGIDPIDALRDAIRRWKELLSGPSVLSEERQRGLYGELWFLELALRQRGVEAITAWLGPKAQAHDFRFGSVEVEIKTTHQERRVHRINGVGQLEPTLGASLFVLSLMLSDAGSGGESLPERVARVSNLLIGDAAALQKFNEKLSMAGYSDVDEEHYTRRYRLRNEPRLIFVGAGTPRITQSALALLPDGYACDRITDVNYDVDFTGFGETCDEYSFSRNFTDEL